MSTTGIELLRKYAAGIALLKQFEGCHLKSYKCPAGVWTIGWGNVRHIDGAPVKAGETITQAVADELLAATLEFQVLPALSKIPHWAAMTAEQQGALLSFAWNLGWNFYGSDGFETISRRLQDKAWHQVPAALLLYRNPGSSFEAGLRRRREAEGQLWSSGMRAAATPAVQPGTDASKPVGRIEALRDTFLKRRPVQTSALGVTDTVEVARGRVYAVVSWREQVADAHVEVELGHGAGTWFIWQPHWRELRDQPAAAVVSGAPEIDWGNFDARVTPNLTVGEVLQKDRRRIPSAGAAVRSRLVATAREFQRVRDAWGRPLGVTSFYRPEPINSQKGGTRNSRHVTGQAFDIYPIGASIDTFYDWIRVRWRGGLGDGRPRGFVHLDTDGGGFVPGAGARPSRWWNY